MSRWIKEGLCNTFHMLFVFVSPSLAPHRPQSFPPAAEEKHAHQRVSGAEQNQGSDQAGRRPAPLQPRQQRVTGPGPVRAPHHAGGGAAPAEVSETRASVRFCSDLGFQTEELIFLLFFFIQDATDSAPTAASGPSPPGRTGAEPTLLPCPAPVTSCSVHCRVCALVHVRHRRCPALQAGPCGSTAAQPLASSP